jgi:hypothetical protein
MSHVCSIINTQNCYFLQCPSYIGNVKYMTIFYCCLLFYIIHKWYDYDYIGQSLLFALFTNIGTRDMHETFFASVFNQFWIKEKLNWTVTLWCSHSGYLTKFQTKVDVDWKINLLSFLDWSVWSWFVLISNLNMYTNIS